MSIVIAGAIAGASLIAGLLVALSEQVRIQLRRRQAVRVEQSPIGMTSQRAPRQSNAAPAAHAVTPESRAAAYREILDALGDELDDDIAEWEAVLQDFPQVIGADEFLAYDDRVREPLVETARELTAAEARPTDHTFTPSQRTRRISEEERGMIQRLLRTGFAPEEIALWLNLPLERVQEFLLRG